MVGVDIVPAIGRCQIHDAGTGIETLRGKVGTISPQVFVIIIGRVTAVCPSVGISECSLPVIWERCV